MVKVLISSLILFAAIASAQPIDIFLVSTLGKNALKNAEVADLVKHLDRLYRDQSGLRFRIIEHRRIPDLFKKWNCLSGNCRLMRLRGWEGYFKKRSRGNHVLHLAILPPIWEQGKYWLGGYASGICTYRHSLPVAYAMAEMFNQDKAPRFISSLTTLAHEVGHLLGATHRSDPPWNLNLMYVQVLAIANQSYSVLKQIGSRFLPESLAEIQQCVGRKLSKPLW